jgi:lipid-A-disaccharide synthase
VSCKNQKHILIIAGEASGDLHGAALVRALKKTNHNIVLKGIGGKKLEESGVEILVGSSELAVVGLTEVLSKLPKIIKAHSLMRSILKNEHPDLLILIDFPDFNISLARTASLCKVPVLYYISPQLWAWRSSRVKKIARRVNKLAVILPFEKEFYLKTGHQIDVEYVGHPLMDSIPDHFDDKKIFEDLDLPMGAPVIGLLPGSRTEEIKNLLPSMIGAAEILSSRYPETEFVLPLASTIQPDLIQSYICRTSLKIHVSKMSIYNILRVCNLALVASGTATLETAIMGVPMVIAYRVSPLSFRIAKMVIKLPYVSLVNLIAGEEIVPELLQDDVTAQSLAGRASSFLENEVLRRETIKKLNRLRDSLGGPGASERTAEIALGMMDISKL